MLILRTLFAVRENNRRKQVKSEKIGLIIKDQENDGYQEILNILS